MNPVSQHLFEPTKSRLKSASFNHLAKHLASSHAEILRATPEERDPPVDADDWRCRTQDMLFFTENQEYQQRTVNMTQPTRLAHWKCWIKTTSYQCGLLSVLINPLVQQSETVGVGSASALAMTKHFQGCWLQVCWQATSGPNLLLYMKLPDFSAQRHHPCPTSSSLLTANLLPKACSHPESSWKETHSTFCMACHNTARSLQWIPAHCGLVGNQEADRLGKSGSKQEQPSLEISYGEAKA